MPINNSFQFQAPSMQQPLANIFNSPVVAKRAPTTADLNYPIGQVWVQPKTAAGVAVNGYWALTSVVNNAAFWTDLVAGAGVFSSLTVTPGPTALTGAFTVTAGTNAVSIGADAANHTTTIGSVTGASPLTLQAGTGASTITTTNGALTINTGTGALGLSTDATINTISIATGAAVKTVNIATGAAANVVTIGSVTGGASTLIRGGIAGVTITAPYLAIAGGNTYIYSGAGVPAGALAVHVGDLYINTTAATATTRLYIADAPGSWTAFTALA